MSREAVVAALYAHSPTGGGCDFGGLVCSNPDHIYDALAAANLLAQPTADEAEGDEREVLVRLLHNEGDGGVWEAFDRSAAEEVADTVLDAGFRRRDPDAGLRERVEAPVDRLESIISRAEEMDRRGPDAFKTGQEHLTPAFREVNWKSAFMALGALMTEVQEIMPDLRAALAADTPTPAPEGGR